MFRAFWKGEWATKCRVNGRVGELPSVRSKSFVV